MDDQTPTDEHGVYLCCSGAQGLHMPGCPVPGLVAERDRYRQEIERFVGSVRAYVRHGYLPPDVLADVECLADALNQQQKQGGDR